MIKAYVVYEDPERVDAVVGWRLVRVKPWGHRGASFDVVSLDEECPTRPEKSGIIKWDGACELTSEPSFGFDSQDQLMDQVRAIAAAFRLSFRWRGNDQAYGEWEEVEELDFRERWNEHTEPDDPATAALGNYRQLRLYYPASAVCIPEKTS